MILIALALALASHHPADNPAKLAAEAAAPASGQSCAECVAAAQNWLKLVDERQYQASWEASGAVFHASVSGAQWASMAQGVREPLGAEVSRIPASATQTNTLPGMPAGQYVVMLFNTKFAEKSGVVETLTLTRENGAWRVIGYFIR